MTFASYSDLYVVAIDWPGHGLSSPRPAGSYYHMINYVADLRHVINGMYMMHVIVPLDIHIMACFIP